MAVCQPLLLFLYTVLHVYLLKIYVSDGSVSTVVTVFACYGEVLENNMLVGRNINQSRDKYFMCLLL